MAKALTVKAVEAAKPDPDRRIEQADPALTGLYLVIQPSGAKSWALRYRYAGKPKKLTLGRWPVMGLADARKAATEALQVLEHGQDPGAKKKEGKAAQLAEQQAQRDTVAALVKRYDKRHLSKLKSGDHARQFLNRFVVKEWGERDVHDIARRDVRDMLERIRDSGREMTANAVLSYARAFFNWCVEQDVLEVAPTMGVRPPAKPTSRDRVLSDDEVRWLWKACDALGEPWGPLVRMLLLTGQRRGEVVGMTVDELDGDVWQIPASRTKNGRAHMVPLTPATVAIVERPGRIAGPYIFTARGGMLSGFSKGLVQLQRAVQEVAEQERGEPVDIPNWTFHDLRRTAATGMARLRIPVRVTEAVLNHVSGTGGGIVAVYQRHDYADEKRHALEAWAQYVTELVEGTADNVVRLGEAQ
jgi:integrase